MTKDARFEDAGGAPLRLKALDEGDLQVVSALVQDAVFPIEEMTWRRTERRFALLLNRFRWEDAASAGERRRGFERVKSILCIEDVRSARTLGIDRADRGTVLSLLSLDWDAGEDGTGAVIVNLAGDGVIRVEVEALEVVLHDVTRPYLAPSGQAPRHE